MAFELKCDKSQIVNLDLHRQWHVTKISPHKCLLNNTLLPEKATFFIDDVCDWYFLQDIHLTKLAMKFFPTDSMDEIFGVVQGIA